MNFLKMRTFLEVALMTSLLSRAKASPIQVVPLEVENGLQSDPLPGRHELLDRRDFQFMIRPQDESCVRHRSTQSPFFFQILVHSKPGHFSARQLIRETWGSIQSVGDIEIEVVFLLGQAASQKPKFFSGQNLADGTKRKDKVFRDLRSISIKPKSTSELSSHIWEEAEQHGDLVQGNFLDSTGNQSYKHIMGLKWVQERVDLGCSPHFVIKTEDTVFLEIFHLVNFVTAAYSSEASHEKSLICDVIPSAIGSRDQTKWSLVSLPTELDAMELHPDYCSGLAYIITPDLLPDILQASTQIPKFWNDDIYVTGFIRESLGISPKYLNLRYTYDEQSYLKWLEGTTPQPFPYIFARLNSTRSNWMEHSRKLWNKTVAIQNREH